MPDRPLLAICVPTYNRAPLLERCLESIKIQLVDNPFLNQSVEISVSDNCSTDNTAQIIENYRKYFSNPIRYNKNLENIGWEKNLFKAVENSTARYGWYMGDDDVVISGGLEFLICQLNEFKYDVVSLTAEPLSQNENYKIKKNFSNDSLLEFDDRNEYGLGGHCQGGMSVLIFDKDLWLTQLNMDEFSKTWLYVFTIMKMVRVTKKKMLCVNVPLVMTGQDCRWVANGAELVTFVTSTVLMERLMDLGFDKTRLLNMVKKNSKRIHIMLLRAKGHDLKCDMENLKYIYKNLKTLNFFDLLLATCIYFIPNPVVKMIRDAKKFLSRDKK